MAAALRTFGRREILKGALAAPLYALLSGTVAKGSQESGEKGMRDLPLRYFGSAARAEWLGENRKLREAVLKDCSCVTPEIGMNWAAIQPTRDTLEFGSLDALAVFARKHGLAMHGHTLIWDQTIPAWAQADMSKGDADWSLVGRYLAAAVSRYPSVPQWNVVNEPIDTEHPDGLKRSAVYDAFGPEYIGMALDEVRRHAPKAKLIINEYSLEYANPVDKARRNRLVRLLEGLLSEGRPLDGLGMQAHLDLGKGPMDQKAISAFLREVVGMGLDIYVTELDVKERDFRPSRAARDRLVADEARRFLDVALAEPAVKGVVTWGMSDDGSWLVPDEADLRASGVAPGARTLNRGLPYDRDMRPKPMYSAIRDALAEVRAA